jgi:hypothetical protein
MDKGYCWAPSEIRVFSHGAQVYAAPTLIYHYAAVHQYKPPHEFLKALREGPRPPGQEYFDALTRLNLEWRRTTKGPPKDRISLSPSEDADCRNYLEKFGTLDDLEKTRLKLEEGLIVPFYRGFYSLVEDREDYLLFEGTVHFDSEKGSWYAMVDRKTFRYEFDTSQSA